MARTSWLALLVSAALATDAQTAEPRLRLWYPRPAAAWTEALPVGNGRLGAMVFGGAAEDRLQLNEDTLWTGSILASRGAWDDVIAMWTRLIDLDPNNGKAYVERGGTYFRKGDLESAMRDAEKGCRLGDQNGCRVSRSTTPRDATDLPPMEGSARRAATRSPSASPAR